MIDYVGFEVASPPLGLNLSESRGETNTTIGVILLLTAAFFLFLRLLTRLRYQGAGIELDDHLMSLGLALNAGNLACCIAGGYWGLGKHIYVLHRKEMRQLSLITFIYMFIYAWSVCAIKFSILALYRRIFGMSYLGWFCVFLTTGYLIATHIVLLLYSRPISHYWNKWYGSQGECLVDEAKFYLAVGIINLFGDICILSVPMQKIWGLQMNKAQKIIISCLFLLGSLVCFASIYRIVTIIRLGKTVDYSWAKSDLFLWSSLEPSIGVISGCLPTLRPLLLHILDRVYGYVPSNNNCPFPDSGADDKHNPIETISKKRSRKINKQDILDTTQSSYIRSEEEDEAIRREATRFWIMNKTKQRLNKNKADQPEIWRLDDEELALTTIVIEGKAGQAGGRSNEETMDHTVEDGRGIHVKTEFDWGEGVNETARNS